jgi:hypothetical protein
VKFILVIFAEAVQQEAYCLARILTPEAFPAFAVRQESKDRLPMALCSLSDTGLLFPQQIVTCLDTRTLVQGKTGQRPSA